MMILEVMFFRLGIAVALCVATYSIFAANEAFRAATHFYLFQNWRKARPHLVAHQFWQIELEKYTLLFLAMMALSALFGAFVR